MWKDIKDYEGLYQISNTGEVLSLRSGKLLTNNVDTNGYLSTKLSKDKVARRFRIHSMVAKAFILNPFGLPEVNHKDGIKANCNDWNLEWCTSSQNKQHAFKTGLVNRKYLQKLTEEQIKEIRASVGKIPPKILAKKFGVVRQTIDGVINNRNYKQLK